MKIAHISVSTLSVLHRYGGGIQRRILGIAQEQVRRGHDVVVFSVGEQDAVIYFGGVRIIQKRCYLPLPLKHFEFLNNVLRNREACSADILHFHSQPEGAVMSRHIRARKFLSFDYYQFRGGRNMPFSKVYQKFLNEFDLLFPVSNYCLEGASDYWNLESSRLRVVYNGVNLNQFHPDFNLRASMRQNWKADGKVVLYVGRVCRQKGTDVLIDAVNILNRKQVNIKLVVAGPIAEFGNSIDNENWLSKIKKVGGLYLGAVEESEISTVFNAADIFVMPTRQLEMFGMAAVEAQACGKPVVASDHGGLKEVVPMGCGLRFPVGDYVQLAEKIELLVDDFTLYSEFVTNAIQNAAIYDWKKICQQLEVHYQIGANIK